MGTVNVDQRKSPGNRPIDQLLFEYAQDHQNLWNQKIHFVCVPLIVWSLLGLLAAIPLFSSPTLSVNVAHIFVLLSLGYYLYLEIKSFVFMLLLSTIYLWSITLLASQGWSLYIYIFVFVVAWLGQFIGHKIEGKKPSFLKDLHFLFIGPIWVFYKMRSNG